jgi:hypothetical protein
MYLSFLPNLPKFMHYHHNHFLFFAMIFALPGMSLILILFSLARNKLSAKSISNNKKAVIKTNSNHQPWYFSEYTPFITVLIVTTLLGYYLLHSTINQHKKNIIASDYYCYAEQWDKAIKIAKTDKEYDLFINYSYNRAIDNTNQYVDQFFSYPQLSGIDGVFPDFIMALEIPFVSSDYYFDVGLISESQHWAYESLVYFPYSVRLMKRLVLTHLINGNYEVAQKYLSLLCQSFHAKDFVSKYQSYVNDTTLVAKDPLLAQKRTFIPDGDELPASIEGRLKSLFLHNHDNIRAFEHLQMSYLLQNKLGNFMQYASYFPIIYKTTPEVFEQAMILYLTKTDAVINVNKFSPGAMQTFKGFSSILMQFKGDHQLAYPLLKESYRNSYLFYVLFENPMVTKRENRIKTEEDPSL